MDRVVDRVEDLRSVRNGRAIEQRLRWIDGSLRWEGRFKGVEYLSEFGISNAQMSGDIDLYCRLSGNNISYNPVAKSYPAGKEFRPLFEIAFQEWLRQRGKGDNGSLLVDVPGLTGTAREKVLQVLIQSATLKVPCTVVRVLPDKGSPQHTLLHPHSFFEDKSLIYTRAWDVKSQQFVTVCASHIITAEIAREETIWIPSQADIEWGRIARLTFSVNERHQQAELNAMELGNRHSIEIYTRVPLIQFVKNQICGDSNGDDGAFTVTVSQDE